MIVNLISSEQVSSIILPKKKDGQYWINDLIAIEGNGQSWILKSNRNMRILDYNNGKQEIQSQIIDESKIYHIKNLKENKNMIIYTEPVTDNRQQYRKKVIVDQEARITIGRNPSNEITYKSQFASSQHAVLQFKNKMWTIIDSDSTNGTFVNNKRVKIRELNFGDTIYIMGLKIIIGGNFIAYNNPDNNVEVHSSSLKDFEMPRRTMTNDEDFDEIEEEEYFYRSPRFKKSIETFNLNISSAPKNQKNEEMPEALTVGPSITMGMGTMVTAITSLATFQIPALISSAGMLLGTMLWPNATKKYQKKKMNEKEKERQEKYTAYLQMIEKHINEEVERQKAILEENYIDIKQCENIILNKDVKLWERSIDQDDFLKLRVGKGETELKANINYQQRQFELNTDELDEQLYLLGETPKIIKDVPIIVSFFEAYMSGIIGQNRKEIIEFAKGLITQISALYSYDEVKMVFIYDKSEENEFEFVKWLPHCWNNDMSFRFIATNSNEEKDVSTYIENEIVKRRELQDDEIKQVMPYYVIFALSKDLTMRSEIIKKLSNAKRNLNMSLITFFDEFRNIPKECSTVVELNKSESTIRDKNDITGQSIKFTPDIMVDTNPEKLSRCLANIKLDLDTDGKVSKLPNLVTFLEMYRVGKIEHLNVFSRWRENNPTKSLEAPIGINTLGEIFKLDLHEKFQGPHGLIAGMTGSGKSELIMTYILSLAINYHPNEVAFILIDYKGGGMAKAFENLPHTAGIITNLDGSEVNRSLISIQSELKRRQQIFAETSKKINVSNIDIYKYQKLYRDGVVDEPLQHLFIISDEFAELKSQQPEFMGQLISTARIGRSLGVHLILATQKPSGVVDDQIWSNSRFKICLKVQDRNDSIDMLKRPEAAEIKETGRFYLQVGYNESFEMGQSAWAGAPYKPSDKIETQKDTSIQIIDKTGRIIKEGKIDLSSKDKDNLPKQLDEITKYLCNLAKEENIKIKQMWLPPIEPVIYLKDIEEKYDIQKDKNEIKALIGEYDDPAKQRQMPFELNISTSGNIALFGITGSGKDMFLNTMIYSLIKNYHTEDLGLYVLDFESESLKIFEKAPQVADVVFSYEKEKVTNLYKLLLGELEKRKKLLSDYGGDLRLYNKESNTKLQNIVVIIHNYEAYKDLYESYEENFAILVREGTKYGINFIITATSDIGVRYRILQNFNTQLTLQLKDEKDYSTIVGRTEGLYPAKYRGRGLVRLDNLYEFQTANITDKDNQINYIRDFCTDLTYRETTKTRKIPVLPNKVDIDFLRENATIKNVVIPIGVETNSLEINYFDFGQSVVSRILSRDNSYGKYVSAFIEYLRSQNYEVNVFDYFQRLNTENTANTAKTCEELFDEIFNEAVFRCNSIKDAKEEGKEIPTYEDKFVIIDNISNLVSKLDEKYSAKFTDMFSHIVKEANIHIILTGMLRETTLYKNKEWYSELVTESNGIWVGSGITEQYEIDPLSQRTSDMRNEELSEEFGYSIIKGKPVKIKLLSKGDN